MIYAHLVEYVSHIAHLNIQWKIAVSQYDGINVDNSILWRVCDLASSLYGHLYCVELEVTCRGRFIWVPPSYHQVTHVLLPVSAPYLVVVQLVEWQREGFNQVL